ncbi:endo alpha-1,4 polygalactosaminidase [Kiloniella sp. b19]|uniref:endo alpha-1,4 polygalactosaminidase n=1 Tax=Kiloniella sp. GXU_MW_B19 TaxID=3141326 RepID=UPI0031DE08C4
MLFLSVCLLAFSLNSPVGAVGAKYLRSGMSFELHLEPGFEPSHAAEIVILDLFNSNPTIVRFLKAKGIVPICFIPAGAVSVQDPDARSFGADLLGQPLRWKPESRWLDIRRRVMTVPLLARRMDLCKAKGFRGALLSEIDHHSANIGFPVKPEDTKSYLRFLSYEAKRRNLFIGIDGASDLAGPLQSFFDFALVSDCLADETCARYDSYVEHGKPVVAVSRMTDGKNQAEFCRTVERHGFFGLIRPEGAVHPETDCDAIKLQEKSEGVQVVSSKESG